MTNRGTAYLHYKHPSSAESAIAHMHEAQLDGAVISVSIAVPRGHFSPSPPPRRMPYPSERDRDRFDYRGRPPPPPSHTSHRGPPARPDMGPSRYRSPATISRLWPTIRLSVLQTILHNPRDHALGSPRRSRSRSRSRSRYSRAFFIYLEITLTVPTTETTGFGKLWV